ncbi:heparinase II/III domain-containing protein [Cohnella lupini]|uniref:Heparinase II/III-like protein n=1 Tax=Cohnella lupini TaxID=1294267 RepID=A0A3D9HT64_9BACL|nr:heparinase II/III family protein [Cohnella lupini]RED52615.1 heparinase II/III-like protein [Cohnella lupini]
MIKEKYDSLSAPDRVLRSADEFLPFPRANDREAWVKLDPESKERWTSFAASHREFGWPALTMSSYMDSKRKGDIHGYLDPHWERRSALGGFVLAECIEDEGTYLNQIVNGIFCVCEETSWMQPIANTYLQKKNPAELLPAASDHVVDLNSSETAALLSWTYYLLKDRLDSISPRIGQRIRREVRDRVLTPYLQNDDYWWMGFIQGQRVNNWNPWCNANVIMSLLVLEEDQEVREQGLLKVMRSLDVFLETHSPDGCCDEGPMYWSRSGGSLYDCLELLGLASSGKLNVFDEPLVRDIGTYLYKVHIHGDYCVDFADGDAIAPLPGDVVYGYGRSIKDDKLMRLGASAKASIPALRNWFPIYRFTRELFSAEERKRLGARAPYARDSWMAHAQVMTARSEEGTEQGLYLAAKGGHNLESHNHNDVGSFLVYADGLPALIDLGTEAYTMKTFSPQRFELWYLQSAYHNLPTVNGTMQRDGGDYRADNAEYRLDGNGAEMKIDIARAYPDESGIRSWERAFRLLRKSGSSIEIVDRFSLNEPTADISFSLMTLCPPVLSERESGKVWLEYAAGRRMRIEYDEERLTALSERIELTDWRLKANWGTEVYRLILSLNAPLAEGEFILRITQEEEEKA